MHIHFNIRMNAKTKIVLVQKKTKSYLQTIISSLFWAYQWRITTSVYTLQYLPLKAWIDPSISIWNTDFSKYYIRKRFSKIPGVTNAVGIAFNDCWKPICQVSSLANTEQKRCIWYLYKILGCCETPKRQSRTGTKCYLLNHIFKLSTTGAFLFCI